MPSRTIATADKSAVTRAILNSEYTASTTPQQTQTDEAVRQALNKVNRVAQFLVYEAPDEDDGSATPPDVLMDSTFYDWWVSEASFILSRAYKRSAIAEWDRARQGAMREAVETFTRVAPNAATGQAGAFSLLGLRRHALANLVRRDNPIFPQIEAVDEAIQEVVSETWNRETWTFRRRQVRMRIVVHPIEDAGWTASTRTLTETGAFTDYTHQTGWSLLVTGGVGVRRGSYVIESRTSSNAVVLVSPLADADVADGITGLWYRVEYVGLGAGETFDSMGSRGLWYEGDTPVNRDGRFPYYVLRQISFQNADDMAYLQSLQRESNRPLVGKPSAFRLQLLGEGRVWQFWPWPDEDVTMVGEVFIRPPEFPGQSDAVTMMAAFPPEMRSVVRDLCLKRVLAKHGRPQEEDREWERIDGFAHVLTDHGNADADQSVRDVYGDARDLSSMRGDGLFGFDFGYGRAL